MNILEKLNKKSPPDELSYNSFLGEIDFTIDEDYLSFIKQYNGAEGFLNPNNYILLWGIQDLIALNPYYEDEPESLNYFFFGSNGSNLGYAFDKKNSSILAIDFLELGVTAPEYLTTSFISFLEKLTD